MITEVRLEAPNALHTLETNNGKILPDGPNSNSDIPLALTPAEAQKLQDDFAAISSNGTADNLENLFVGQFLRELISGKRPVIQGTLNISTGSQAILYKRFIEGAWWKNTTEATELSAYHQRFQERGKIAIKKIVKWLEPLGGSYDTIKEVLESLSKVKAKAKRKLSETQLICQQWLESFNAWLKGIIQEVKPIHFNLRDKNTRSVFSNLINQLKIKLDQHLQIGKIIPVSSEHGFVLEAKSKTGKQFHRYLMAYNPGELLEQPKRGEKYEFLDGRIGWRFDIYKLLWGFGPVDLNGALHRVRVISQITSRSVLQKRIDLRLHQDDFGYEIPIPIAYKGKFLKPYVSPEDLEKGIRRVTFYAPKSNEPVIEVIFTSTEKGYESNYLGKYASLLPSSGPLKKATKDIREFLNGERSTPPPIEKLPVHEHRGSRYIAIAKQTIPLTRHLPKGVREVKLRFVSMNDSSRALELYLPDAEPNAKPLAILRANHGVIKIAEAEAKPAATI